MSRPDVHDGWWAAHANLASERTARCKAAGLWNGAHVRKRAFNGCEGLHAAIKARNGGQEPDRIGMLRRFEQCIDSRMFDDFARIHDGNFVANLRNHSQVVRNKDNGGVRFGLEAAQEVEHLRLDGDVKRRGRLVGDQKLWVASEGHGDHCALTHAARKLVRVFIDALLGRGNSYVTQQLDGAGARLAAREPAVADQRLADLLADRVRRIERGHRLLKDHGKPIAAQVAHRCVGEIEKIVAVKADAAGNFGGSFRQQAHDGERSDAFAAAGFADEPKRDASREIEANAFDRVGYPPTVAVKYNLQIFDVDEGRHCRFSPASSRAISLSIMDRSVTPTGSRRPGRKRRNDIHRSRLTRSSRSSSASGST